MSNFSERVKGWVEVTRMFLKENMGMLCVGVSMAMQILNGPTGLTADTGWLCVCLF